RRLLEAVVADALEVLLRDHPAGAGRHRAVEGHEVGPRALEPEADTIGIDHVHARDPGLEGAGGGAPIALHRELDVLGGEGIAVVELHPLPADELVAEPVRGRWVPRPLEAAGRTEPGPTAVIVLRRRWRRQGSRKSWTI